jgi:hypothetical protein
LYERKEVAKRMLTETEHWRIVNFDMSNPGTYIDWTHEREWRLPGDLEFKLNVSSAPHVVLYDKQGWDYFRDNCPPSIFKGIFGLSVLKSILM